MDDEEFDRYMIRMLVQGPDESAFEAELRVLNTLRREAKSDWDKERVMRYMIRSLLTD